MGEAVGIQSATAQPSTIITLTSGNTTAADGSSNPSQMTASDTPDVSSTSANTQDTITISSEAQQAAATAQASAQDPASSDNGANMQDLQVVAFYSNAAIVTDTSGKYSQDDQLQAYVNLWNTMEAGFPQGLGNDAGTVFNDAMLNSSIGQLQQQLSQSFNNAGVAAFQMGNSNNAPAIASAELKVANGWSDFEKQVFFETDVNEKLKIGGNHYSSIDAWISDLQNTANSVPPGASPAAAAQPAMPVGLSDKQKKDVAAIIGNSQQSSTSTTSAASSTTAAVAAPVDAKTALAQSVAKLLSSAHTATPTKHTSTDHAGKIHENIANTTVSNSQSVSLTELIGELNSNTPIQGFSASPKSAASSGTQLNQSV
ncbi:MAG TPA: hypothetical protein VHZ32_15020 [Rhizomicrobium sp.]|nr:hypothetical protein [Rhizomicrobium sp.]